MAQEKYWHNNCPYIVNFTVYVSTIYNIVVLHSFWEIRGMSCKEKLWVRARRGTAIQPVLIQKDDSDESEGRRRRTRSSLVEHSTCS